MMDEPELVLNKPAVGPEYTKMIHEWKKKAQLRARSKMIERAVYLANNPEPTMKDYIDDFLTGITEGGEIQDILNQDDSKVEIGLKDAISNEKWGI